MSPRLLLLAALLAGCAGAPPTGPAPYPTADTVAPGAIALHRLAPDVWTHVSTFELEGGTVYPSNGLVVRDGDGVWLVDTAWGEAATAALLAAVDAEIGLPVRGAVSTHFHDDRVAGADVLRERGIPVYASSMTRRLAAAEGNAVPSDSLAGLTVPGALVQLGAVEVYFPGGGHTRDNVVVYVPDAGVLAGGCAVHEAARTTAGNTADADLDTWPDALRSIRDRFPDAEIVVPGHGPPGTRALLDHSIALVEAAHL
ncbi:subclass B1 metallo-beta-lactamase [Rubrivirga sp. IMCC45206]|uniref:subclass B1 metallo-beta-lactamase n=1 Tax=Rubrivirga sp. IMCC45206 TaxID=3391614 RepID=UPI00398FB85E